MNFLNQRLWRHLAADFTIIMVRSTLKVTANHVMYDRGAWFQRLRLRLITLPRPWLFLISWKPHPINCLSFPCQKPSVSNIGVLNLGSLHIYKEKWASWGCNFCSVSVRCIFSSIPQTWYYFLRRVMDSLVVYDNTLRRYNNSTI